MTLKKVFVSGCYDLLHSGHVEFFRQVAAYKHVPMMENNRSEAVLNNIYGTKIVADLSVKYEAKKFVMVSDGD